MVPGTAWKGSGWVWTCSSVPVKNTAEETWAMAFYIVPACVRGDSIQRSQWNTKGDAATFTAELNGNSFTCTYIGDCIINLLNSVPLLCRTGFVALTVMFSQSILLLLSQSPRPCRQRSARTTRPCQTPLSKPYAGSSPSPAPRSTGTKSSATRSAKKCRTLNAEMGRFTKCLCAKNKTWSYAK